SGCATEYTPCSWASSTAACHTDSGSFLPRGWVLRNSSSWRHQSELDQKQVLLDIMVIADEVDAQLMETVSSLMRAKLAAA
ncbi:MAG: hypothetical protein WB625_05670, partial [Candidatus Sulfotelmatobacter sp.]